MTRRPNIIDVDETSREKTVLVHHVLNQMPLKLFDTIYVYYLWKFYSLRTSYFWNISGIVTFETLSTQIFFAFIENKQC